MDSEFDGGERATGLSALAGKEGVYPGEDAQVRNGTPISRGSSQGECCIRKVEFN